MPIDKYFKGHGDEVMASMRKTYGKDAERVFYATKNKMKNAKKSAPRKRGSK